LQRYLPEFENRNCKIIGVSVDPPDLTRERVIQPLRLGYTILSDARREVIEKYKIVHRGAGMAGTDVARPAEFLIDPQGVVRWTEFTENWRIRARPEQILEVLDAIQSPKAALRSKD
jgi:peroxiredoxin